MAIKSKKLKKYVPSAAELVNDPSLKWHQYKQGEAVYCETLQENVRFMSYQQDKVKLATLNGIAEIPGLFDKLSIRRLTSR